jgi:hypothetical protein
MIERIKKQVSIQNQAEQVRQGYLGKGLAVANEARAIFVSAKDGKRVKAVRKFAEKVF